MAFTLLVDEPTLNVKVDVDVETFPLVEIGSAGLTPQSGIDDPGQLAGNSAWIGVQLYSEAAKLSAHLDGIGAGGVPYVGATFLNLDSRSSEPAAQRVPALWRASASTPSDPLMFAATAALSIAPFTDGAPPARPGLNRPTRTGMATACPMTGSATAS